LTNTTKNSLLLFSILLLPINSVATNDEKKIIQIAPIIIPTTNKDTEHIQSLNEFKAAIHSMKEKSTKSEKKEDKVLETLEKHVKKTIPKINEFKIIKETQKVHKKHVIKKKITKKKLIKKKTRTKNLQKKALSIPKKILKKKNIQQESFNSKNIMKENLSKLNFVQTLGVVKQSKPFILETNENNNPNLDNHTASTAEFNPKQGETYEGLTFIDTLGVVGQSKPFVIKGNPIQ